MVAEIRKAAETHKAPENHASPREDRVLETRTEAENHMSPQKDTAPENHTGLGYSGSAEDEVRQLADGQVGLAVDRSKDGKVDKTFCFQRS